MSGVKIRTMKLWALCTGMDTSPAQELLVPMGPMISLHSSVIEVCSASGVETPAFLSDRDSGARV